MDKDKQTTIRRNQSMMDSPLLMKGPHQIRIQGVRISDKNQLHWMSWHCECVWPVTDHNYVIIRLLSEETYYWKRQKERKNKPNINEKNKENTTRGMLASGKTAYCISASIEVIPNVLCTTNCLLDTGELINLVSKGFLSAFWTKAWSMSTIWTYDKSTSV